MEVKLEEDGEASAMNYNQCIIILDLQSIFSKWVYNSQQSLIIFLSFDTFF